MEKVIQRQPAMHCNVVRARDSAGGRRFRCIRVHIYLQCSSTVGDKDDEKYTETKYLLAFITKQQN
jgi:hypothetical protein